MRRVKNKNPNTELHIWNLEHVEDFKGLIKYVKRVCKCDSLKEAEKHLMNSVNPLENQIDDKYFFKSTEQFIYNMQFNLRTQFHVITYIVS
jgi:hypothetical protein